MPRNKTSKAAKTAASKKAATTSKAAATPAAKTAAASTQAAPAKTTAAAAKPATCAATKPAAASTKPSAQPAVKAATPKAAAAKPAASSTSAAAKPAATGAAPKAAAKPAAAAATPQAAAKPATKATASKTSAKPAAATPSKASAKPAATADAAKTVAAKPAAQTAASKTSSKKTAAAKPAAQKKAAAATPAAKKPAASKAESGAKPEKGAKVEPETKAEVRAKSTAAKPATKAAAKPKAASKPKPAPKPKAEPAPKPEPAPEPTPAPEPELPQPRRSVAFIGSECYPFVKTGGLGDVMYALPKALVKLNCDVRVILPKYACIKDEFKEKMEYRGAFDMDLCSDGRMFYVGVMEYVADGVIYDFVDNEEFFSNGNPYTNLVDDIPKFCYFSKAALAVLNYLNWIPDVIHCHDWQAGLVPIFLRTMFAATELSRSRVITTIHNLRFQGKYNIPTLKYWSNLPDNTFSMGALQEEWTEANMLKGGLAYSDAITTVSNTYAGEIQTWEYGEGLDAHLRHHSYKLRGIVNGIDYDIWNPATDALIYEPFSVENAIEQKRANKLALQKELGLEENGDKMIIGLISRLTNQKGLDLVNAIVNDIVDGNTQLVVLGTGDPQYEDSFRYYENAYKGQVCSCIMYDESRSHKIYAGCDAFLVPSQFEPCGLTQLIAMHYGSAPIVRETGGLKDTVEPYNIYEDTGNGFTFDRYDAGLLLDAINRAKTLYFTKRESWNAMVIRNMQKDVSWENSAWQYRNLYLELTQ